LEREVDNKNKPIHQLESYIHSLENHINNSKSNRLVIQNDKASHLERTPLILPHLPKVSVIIVTWNGEEYIKRCLNSITEDTYKNIECIVVDNGSSDRTTSIISSKFDNVTLIKLSKNEGFCRGVNVGIAHAKGDVILLINQDVIIKTGLIQALIECLESNPMIVIAGCKIYNPDGTIQHAGGILHKNGLTDHFGSGEEDKGQYDIERDCDYVTGAVFAFKAELIRKIGFFDKRFSPAYFEELDFCMRAKRAQYRVVYTFKGSAIHFESTSTGKFSKRFYYLYHRNRLFFMLKHYTFKYMISDFLKTEIIWIRTAFPKDQFLPLIKAYLRVSYRFAWILFRDLINLVKRRGK